MAMLLLPSLPALTEPHERFFSRLRFGVEEAGAVAPSPNSPPPPRRRPAPSPPAAAGADVCQPGFNFECDADAPSCAARCRGCGDTGCFVRCYEACERAPRQQRTADECHERCGLRLANCTDACAAEAAQIAAAAKAGRRSANTTAASAHADARCTVADTSPAAADDADVARADAFPFDCGAPCLQQCGVCGDATRCITRCYHQCAQGTTCTKLCAKVDEACTFVCRKIESNQVTDVYSVLR